MPKELVVKYSRSKWDHLFDITTVRKDERLYKWMFKVENTEFINNQLVFQNFCKGVKENIENIDTNMLSEEELFGIYDEIMLKSIIIVNYMKNNNIKLNSKKRTQFFEQTAEINSSDKSKIIEVLDNIKNDK